MTEFKRKLRNRPNMEKPVEKTEAPENTDTVDTATKIDDKTFKVKVVSDFRKFKAGEEFDFSLPINVIVGENGSGKSSLIHAIRGKYEKKSGSLFNSDYVKLSKHISVETGIKHYLFFDSIKDDGANMNNAYDAMAFMTNGGYQTKNLSHGETQLFYISKLVADIEKIRKTSSEKIMVVLDEFDKGFSLTNQSKVINILYNISNKFDCKIICISHNYMLIDKIGIVYDMDKRNFALSKKYLAKFNEATN